MAPIRYLIVILGCGAFFAFLLSNKSDAAIFGAYFLGLAANPLIKWAGQ